MRYLLIFVLVLLPVACKRDAVPVDAAGVTGEVVGLADAVTPADAVTAADAVTPADAVSPTVDVTP